MLKREQEEKAEARDQLSPVNTARSGSPAEAAHPRDELTSLARRGPASLRPTADRKLGPPDTPAVRAGPHPSLPARRRRQDQAEPESGAPRRHPSPAPPPLPPLRPRRLPECPDAAGPSFVFIPGDAGPAPAPLSLTAQSNPEGRLWAGTEGRGGRGWSRARAFPRGRGYCWVGGAKPEQHWPKARNLNGREEEGPGSRPGARRPVGGVIYQGPR